MGFDGRHDDVVIPCSAGDCESRRTAWRRHYRPNTTGRSVPDRNPSAAHAQPRPRALAARSFTPNWCAADVVQVVGRGAPGEADLEVVGREVDRAAHRDEPRCTCRGPVGVVAGAARRGADVHHVAPPGVVGGGADRVEQVAVPPHRVARFDRRDRHQRRGDQLVAAVAARAPGTGPRPSSPSSPARPCTSRYADGVWDRHDVQHAVVGVASPTARSSPGTCGTRVHTAGRLGPRRPCGGRRRRGRRHRGRPVSSGANTAWFSGDAPSAGRRRVVVGRQTLGRGARLAAAGRGRGSRCR